MSVNHLVAGVYLALSLAVVLLPLRWSLIAYLLLSTVDVVSTREGVGALNAVKGIILPLYLLWRLRRYSGHRKIILAPVAWMLLIVYAAIAASWSMFPIAAFKLVGHMAGSFLICCMFMRASKGRYLDPHDVLPVTIGAIILAVLRSAFLPNYGDEAARFTSFSTAQSFAAFLAALYCVALCSRAIRPGLRICLSAVLLCLLVLDGSRIWTIGVLLATLCALIIADVRPWIKLCGIGLALVSVSVLVGSWDTVFNSIAKHAESNRIAAAITAVYEGNLRSSGLGTYNLRRGFDARELNAIVESSITQLALGHGTSNGAVTTGIRFNSATDPNRLMHNEWFRVMYEWGFAGMALFLMFLSSISVFGIQGLRREYGSYAKPLVVFLPGLLLGLAGENILAGAGNAVSVGFLFLIALASVAHRQPVASARGREALPMPETAPERTRKLLGRETWAT